MNMLKKVALALILVVTGLFNAWASSTYYSKVSVWVSPQGAGQVYIQRSGGAWQDDTDTWEQALEDSPSVTYMLNARTKSDSWWFKGWFEDQNGAKLLSDQIPYAYSFDARASKDNANKRVAKTVYACFEEVKSYSVTLLPNEYGTVKYKRQDDSSYLSVDSEVNFGYEVVRSLSVQANPQDGYKFYGWYVLEQGEKKFVSFSASAKFDLHETVTIGAEFFPASEPVFQVNLNEAVELQKLH